MLHYDLRAVAHYHRTQCPDQNGHWAYKGQHFWLRGIHTSDKNGNACITGTTNFKISFKIWLLMHMTAYTGKVPWPSSATARGLGGGVCDKLAIDKGGNLPEKVENHWPRPTLSWATGLTRRVVSGWRCLNPRAKPYHTWTQHVTDLPTQSSNLNDVFKTDTGGCHFCVLIISGGVTHQDYTTTRLRVGAAILLH